VEPKLVPNLNNFDFSFAKPYPKGKGGKRWKKMDFNPFYQCV